MNVTSIKAVFGYFSYILFS